MQRYYVTTDQTADFPKELYKDAFGIIPMTYVLDGVLYDGENTPFLSSRDFYEKLSEGKDASTSMVSVEKATAFFESILKDGMDVLHISFSSALSGCYESYVQAASLLKSKYPGRRVAVVDSKCASAGEGLLVYYVLKKRDEGAELEENEAYATQLRDHIGHAFTVNDMFHLYRGGRVSKATAVVGSTIRIKPVLMVSEEGKLIPTNNVIGRKIAVRTLADKMEAKGKSYKNDLILIAHGDCERDALILKETLLSRFGRQNIIITEIGAVIGSHCGKGVLALFYLAADKHPFLK